MKIALTVWEDRVSPVFDSASTFLIVKVEGTKVEQDRYFHFAPQRLLDTVTVLKKHGVEIIICGAVSEIPALMIESSGLRLIPFITGEIKLVLSTLANSKASWTRLMMPGCRRNPCCKKKMEYSSLQSQFEQQTEATVQGQNILDTTLLDQEE